MPFPHVKNSSPFHFAFKNASRLFPPQFLYLGHKEHVYQVWTKLFQFKFVCGTCTYIHYYLLEQNNLLTVFLVYLLYMVTKPFLLQTTTKF